MSSNGPKTLVLDIERMKGSFRRQTRGLTISGEFWSLFDYKRMIGRIHADDVIEWPRTICVAWRFVGKKRVEFASEWGDGQAGMHSRIWEAVDEADVVVGHNVKGFDLKHLRTGWRDLDFLPPSPVAVVDTLKEARAEFGDESKTLDALTKRIGIASKTDRYDLEVARAALAGDQRAQRKLKAYNVGDIEASEELYLSLRPWMKSHPSVGLYSEDGVDVCSCGGREFIRNGYAYTRLSKFQRYQCKSCGLTLRGRKSIASVDLRAVA